MGHTCPREFIYRPQRWFMFDPANGETVILRDQRDDELLTPHKFVIHRHKSKSGLTIRSGLARVASWAWMYKQFTLKDWAIFVQNYGMPIRIGKYNGDASEDEKDVLWRAVRNIAGDCAAIVPVGMEIEFHEVASKGSTTDLYERRADWMDRQISKAVLGQTTTTDAVSGGHAVAKEHRLVQEDIERSDAIALSATVNRQVVPNMVAFNFGPQDHYPKVLIGRPDEVPLEEFSAAFERLGSHGLTAPMSYMRNRLGIPEPKPDDEVVGGRPATASIGADGPVGTASQRMAALFDTIGTTPADRGLGAIGALVRSRQSNRRGDELVDRLTARLEEDAAGAIAGLAEEIRTVLLSSASLTEAAERLSAMRLSPAELSDAMARGMALAHMAGQAALINDIERRK